MHTYQKIGELRFIVTMQWENISNPYGTIAYYDEDQKIIKDYCSLSDLLFQMDAACDEQGHPQRDTILRSFGKALLQQNTDDDIYTDHPEKNNCKGLYFIIAVCMRQHSSMQGYFQIRDEKYSFRSGMELVKLLSDVMLCYGKRRVATLCQKNI